jgi:hypothetical protein
MYASRIGKRGGFEYSPPIGKFLSGKPVDHNVFKEICFKLNLDWKETADLPRDIEPEPEERSRTVYSL